MTLGCKTSKDVMKAIKEHGVEMVDIRLTDMPGMWQHISYPAAGVRAGRDRRGPWASTARRSAASRSINESDMLLMPDPTTAFIDPFMAHKTLVMIADVKDPVTKELYSRDPRGVAKKAEAHLKSTGHRRHRLFRSRGRVLRVRQRPVRHRPAIFELLASIRAKATGTRTGTRARTSATRSGRRKATSPARPTTRCRICAPRWR